MRNNERGGILSKLIIIPAGVALMVGFFFLGYYVGKYQSKSGTQNEVALPLPDVDANNPAKKEEFTFYKTLTDKKDKTVSIDLKPKAASEGNMPEKKQTVAEAPKSNIVQPLPKEKQLEIKIEKDTDSKTQPKQTASKQPQPQTTIKTKTQTTTKTKKEPVPAESSITKARYTIQLASYQEKEMAENDVKQMKRRGYAAFIIAAELPDKGMWYRVRLGSFSNKAAAEKLQKELQTKEGISPIVVTE